MPRLKVAVIVVAGRIVTTAPAAAGLVSTVGLQLVKPDVQVEQIRYRSNALPEELMGGVIAGVLGGVVGLQSGDHLAGL